MTQRYPKTLWDVFHGMFTTNELNAIEEWGFENVAILTLELMVARHTAAIHTGSTSWFPELRTAQKAAYVEIKQWYETNVRPAIDAEKAIESNWFMGGKNVAELKNKLDQIDKEKGKA